MKFATIVRAAVLVPLLMSAPAMAQTGDQRVLALEDQLRQLNGLVEELNFQVLQMQDQLRRMQEDNEFRFQELEGGSGGSSGSGSGNDQGSLTPPAATTDTAAIDAPSVVGSDNTLPGVAATGADAPVAGTPGAGTPGQGTGTGQPPRELGSITFDPSGNIRTSQANPQAAPSTDGTTVAALPAASDPGQAYRDSYEFILAGDYTTAEAGFRDLIARFPESEQIPDAQFWLGEALLGQSRYRDAAETFLTASRDHPQSRRAPEMLFKLGVSLAALNQREVACATFAEVGQRYPQISDALRQRVEQERQLASC